MRRAAAQWLLSLGRPGRRVMVLSGNSLEHAVFELAAMQARDLDRAQSFLAPGFQMQFPGGVRFTTLQQLVDWGASLVLRFGVFLTGKRY